MSDDPERGWLLASAAGDREAFRALMRHVQPALWHFVRRLTLDPEVAEDVLQETWIGAWRAAATYTGEGSARGWLYGLARRQAARSWRRRVGEPVRAESLESLGELAGWGQDPERAAERAEDRAGLLAAIAGLSESDQDVLVRCDLEGASAQEAADALGLTANATRVRLHRARLRLMAVLRQGGADAGT